MGGSSDVRHRPQPERPGSGLTDRISLSKHMGRFSCTDGTSLEKPLSFELNLSIQYG